jgi:hypothetical protein
MSTVSSSDDSKKIVLAVITVAAAVSLGVGVRRVLKQRTRVKKLQGLQVEQYGVEHYDFSSVVKGRITCFQRFVLAEARVKFDVPTYTQANLVIVRRYVVSVIREFRPTVRGTDLEMHADIITPLVFLPSEKRTLIAELMDYRPTWWQRWFWEKPDELPTARMDSFKRPIS